MGDTIMVRSFAPLPRLEEVTFLRPESRDFVTGKQPYRPLNRPWLGYLFFGYGVMFTIAAIAVTLVAYQPTMVLGQPLSPEYDWLQLLGPILFIPALLDLGLGYFFRRRAEDEKQLGADGGLIAGELIASKVKAAKGGNYLQAECRFTSPQGQVIT